MDVLIAHDYRTGQIYCREFGLDPKTTVIVTPTRGHKLFGYGRGCRFIYVNSDNGEPDEELVDRLKWYDALGYEVDWFGFEEKP